MLNGESQSTETAVSRHANESPHFAKASGDRRANAKWTGLPAARKSPGIPPTDNLHEKWGWVLLEYFDTSADAVAELLHDNVLITYFKKYKHVFYKTTFFMLSKTQAAVQQQNSLKLAKFLFKLGSDQRISKQGLTKSNKTFDASLPFNILTQFLTHLGR